MAIPTRVVTPVGELYSGPVGSISADAYAPLTATIDWGDGTTGDADAVSCLDCADGLALQAVTGTHTYTTAGRHPIVVTVFDALAGTRLQIHSTAVVRTATRPRPRLVGPRRFAIGRQVRWRVPIALPPGAHRLFTVWSLGAGGGLDAVGGGRFLRGMNATPGSVISGSLHHAGPRRLAVHVTDDLGDSFHLAVNVAVASPIAGHARPLAAFRFDDFPTAGSALNIWGDFSDPGMPPKPLDFSWDFGDGATGAGFHPAHVYAFGGRYRIRLTVTNGNGSDTVTDVVTVVGTKICNSVELRGIRAFFSGCLQPFEVGVDGVLSYTLQSSPIVINGVFFRSLTAGYPIILKPATGTVWSAVTLERPLCPANKPCSYIGASGGFTVPKPNADGESIVAEGINASLFGKIAGFALAGTATLHLYTDYQRPALYEANVILPPPFVGSGAVKEGASLADFTIAAPNASFGPLNVVDLKLTRSSGVTSATGKLVLPAGPPVGAAFAFAPNGSLVSASADATFNPPVPFGPLIALDEFHGAYGASPFHLVGSGTFGTTARVLGAPVVQATGCLLFGVLKAGQSLGDCAVPGATPFTAAPATVLRVSGSASLFGRIGLGNGYADVSSATGIWFGGTVDYGFPPGVPVVSVDGTVAGHIGSATAWQTKAGLHGCIKHVKCTGVETLISSKGIVACASFFWGDPGGYYRWSGGWGLMMHGCDVDSTGGVATGRPAGRRVLSHAPTHATVRLAGGTRFEAIAISGTGSSPRVTLAGPRGERVVDDGSPFQQHGRVAAIFHLDEQGTPPSPDGSYVPNTTYVYVIRPRAGTWTITTNPGSSSITAIRTAGSLPAVDVRARVRSLGGRRFALDYDVGSLRGQRVTFVEVGRRPLVHRIGAVTRSHGTIRFTAALGPAGTRTVEAQVEQDGLPRAVVRPTRFAVPRSTLAAPAIAARASGTTLRVSWIAVPEAEGYTLDIVLRDGRHLRVTAERSQRTFTVDQYARTDGARITVRAVGGGVTGAARTLRLAPRGLPAPVEI